MSKICIFGDICPDNDYRIFFDNGKLPLSQDIISLIEEADYTIANLECPATESTNAITKCGPSLKAKPTDLQLLKNAGFNALSLANNHILDYGTQAAEETISLCKEIGIETFGAGIKKEAKKLLIKQIGNKTFGFLSFAEEEFNLASENTVGANHFDPYESLQEIQEAKKSVDCLIILYHGGIEHYQYPSPTLQKKCRTMTDFGADIVLCQHSHCIGTLEKYNDSVILYGQGNSLFGYRQNDSSWNEGYIVTVDTENPTQLSFHLIEATPMGIVLSDSQKNGEKTAELLENSRVLTDNAFINQEWKKFVNKKKTLYYPLLFGLNRVFNKLNRLTDNKIVDILFGKKAQMITMNIIRCESHNEVAITMLEERVYGKK